MKFRSVQQKTRQEISVSKETSQRFVRNAKHESTSHCEERSDVAICRIKLQVSDRHVLFDTASFASHPRDGSDIRGLTFLP